jgi:hypothetical protein
MVFKAETTTTAATTMAVIQSEWVDATHATRKADIFVTVWDTAGREAMRMRASGTAAQIGFLGATPVSRQSSTADIKDVLVNFGFLTDGGATPLNLDAGAFTAGTITGTFGTFTQPVDVTLTDAVTNDSESSVVEFKRESSGTPAAGFGGNIAFRLESSTTANRLAGRIDWEWETATDASRAGRIIILPADSGGAVEAFRCDTNGSTVAQIGFFGTTAVVQHATTGETTGTSGGAGTAFRVDGTVTGNVGSAAYTIGDIVKCLKNYGLMAQ